MEKKVDVGKMEIDGFSGYILIKVPGYVERMDLAKKFVKADSDELSVEEKIELAKQLYQESADKIVGLHISYDKDGVKETFSSLEELEVYEECMEIVNEVTGQIVGGLQLGKKKKKKSVGQRSQRGKGSEKKIDSQSTSKTSSSESS